MDTNKKNEASSSSLDDIEKKIHAKMISADDLVFCGKAIIPYCFPDSCNVKVHFEEKNLLNKRNFLLMKN